MSSPSPFLTDLHSVGVYIPATVPRRHVSQLSCAYQVFPKEEPEDCLTTATSELFPVMNRIMATVREPDGIAWRKLRNGHLVYVSDERYRNFLFELFGIAEVRRSLRF
jgi:hypothetical protein